MIVVRGPMPDRFDGTVATQVRVYPRIFGRRIPLRVPGSTLGGWT